jgi:hypothetical protein
MFCGWALNRQLNVVDISVTDVYSWQEEVSADPADLAFLNQCYGSVSEILCLFDPGPGIWNRFFPDPGS